MLIGQPTGPAEKGGVKGTGSLVVFDEQAFAASLSKLLSPPIRSCKTRAGEAAAYLCTKGLKELRDVIRPLSYRFDRVFVLATEPVDLARWANVEELHWRNGAAAFHEGLETTGLAPAFGVPRDWDLPTKRTAALEHARRNHFAVGLLIDDDIGLMGSEDLQIFRSLENALLGRPPNSCPDQSVLEETFGSATPHAFPNGNYLFFDPAKQISFFPKIYNDDWLFVWSSRGCRPTITASGSLRHGARSFVPEERARQQEAGETLVKGLCADGSDILDEAYWAAVMTERREYVSGLRALAATPRSLRMVEAALSVHHAIDAADVVEWCRAFMSDCRKWRSRLEIE